jgi:hypothetical protein
MLRAQMRQILQARDILIEQAISSTLDHALRRQLIDVLPRAAEVNRQLVAAHQNRSMRRAVAPLRPGRPVPLAIPLTDWVDHRRPSAGTRC